MLLGFIRFCLLCRDLVNEFFTKNCPPFAAAIAFYAFFSLFPLALALISGLGFFLGLSSVSVWMAEEVGSLFPVSTDLVSQTIQGVIRAKGVTGIAGILGLLWASQAVFGAIRKGVNAAWGVRKPRPFWQERLIDLSLMVGATLLLLVSIGVTVTLTFFREVSRFMNPLFNGFFWDGLGLMVPFLLSFLTFLGLYRVLPNTRVRVKEVLPGAFLAAVAFEVGKRIFVWYIKTYPTYNLVYGSVGAVVALLAWIYISALILLCGALISSRFAAYLARQEKRRVTQRTLAPAFEVGSSGTRGN